MPASGHAPKNLPAEILLDRQLHGKRAPVAGGQSNPTWLVTIGERRLVLRKQRPGGLLRGAHAIDREYRVQSALSGSAVPVPGMLAWWGDASVPGTPLYLVEHIDGRVWHQTAMPDVTPADRRGMYPAVARSMAAPDPMALGLQDYGRPGNCFARQMARWGSLGCGAKPWRSGTGPAARLAGSAHPRQ